MPLTWWVILLIGAWIFALGSVVGSFINVCVFRLPWQKSVIWPGSHCLKCWHSIAARDNIPIFGWVLLGGKCRGCGDPISSRYPLVEALVGLLFTITYVVEVVLGPRTWAGEVPLASFAVLFFHAILIALLVTATFIDYDLMIIPDEVTVLGMVTALVMGTICPWIRLEPATATTPWGGFWVGMIGLIVGGGVPFFIRQTASVIFRREAMGFGDVTLMAMIGAFLGWQAAVLAFFLGPFLGIAHALWKLVKYVGKVLSGKKSSSADRELPFGPYLSMAAVALVFSWRWLWPLWARELFETLRVLPLWLMGLEP